MYYSFSGLSFAFHLPFMDVIMSNAGFSAGVIVNKFLKAMGTLTLAQEEQGDDLLSEAHDLVVNQAQSLVEGNDLRLRVVEDEITQWDAPDSLKCIAANVHQCPGDDAWTGQQIWFSKIPLRLAIP